VQVGRSDLASWILITRLAQNEQLAADGSVRTVLLRRLETAWQSKPACAAILRRPFVEDVVIFRIAQEMARCDAGKRWRDQSFSASGDGNAGMALSPPIESPVFSNPVAGNPLDLAQIIGVAKASRQPTKVSAGVRHWGPNRTTRPSLLQFGEAIHLAL
jgi:hypothetical protein